MDEDQKRAIGRTSCIVEDLLTITIGDCVLFVGRHVGMILGVGVESNNGAVGGCVRVVKLKMHSCAFMRSALRDCDTNAASSHMRSFGTAGGNTGHYIRLRQRQWFGPRLHSGSTLFPKEVQNTVLCLVVFSTPYIMCVWERLRNLIPCLIDLLLPP